MEEREVDKCHFYEDFTSHTAAAQSLIIVKRAGLHPDGTLNYDTYIPARTNARGEGISMCVDCGFKVAWHRHRPTSPAAAQPSSFAQPQRKVIQSKRDIIDCGAMGRTRISEREAEAILIRLPSLIGLPLTEVVNTVVEAFNEMEKRAKTSTRYQFTQTVGVSLNGPFCSADHPRIITGMTTGGVPVIVKFVPKPPEVPPQDYHGATDEHSIALHAARMELFVSKMTADCAFLVRCDAHDANEALVARDPAFTQTKTQTKVGIVMPHYPLSAAGCAPLDYDTLADKLSMVVNALTFLHSKGIVHMDVKPSNIFIDHEGGWHLGDFDSCCFYDRHIYSTTNGFHLVDVSLDIPAKYSHDWGMLLCTTATLMVAKGQRAKGSPISDLPPDIAGGKFRGHMNTKSRDDILNKATGKLAELVQSVRQRENHDLS